MDTAEIREHCLALRMRLANRVVTKIYDDGLRPFGLRVPQFAMLALAEERGLLRQADVCAELQLDDSTLSRNLERMRGNGWLEEVVADDARERPHQITRKGSELLRRALPAWRNAQETASKLLGTRGVEALRAFAKRLAKAT